MNITDSAGKNESWTLLDVLPYGKNNSIIGCSHDGSISSFLTHDKLRELVISLDVRKLGIRKNDRVALIMPNGPMLGTALLVLMAQCIVLPIEITRAAKEIVSTLNQLKATHAVFPISWKDSELVYHIIDEANVNLCFLSGDEPNNLDLVHNPRKLDSSKSSHDEHTLQGNPILSSSLLDDNLIHVIKSSTKSDAPLEKTVVSPIINEMNAGINLDINGRYTNAGDNVLVLNTSGTSGKKKIIVYKLKKLILGAKCVAKSWALTANDVNLNMMPLCHIGGIVRNLLAPILIGGSTILAAGFDQIIFWNIYNLQHPTWYYAVPSMHMAILDEGRRRKIILEEGQSIRMICNAGGGMQHSLALELKNFFKGSTVLPSYGMSECMPISTPPVNYALEHPGTSGKSVGSEIEIAIYSPENIRLPPRKVGSICVKGEYLFEGYENDDEETEKVFNSDGFFITGDIGYIDEEDYLFIIGRSKEIINRGGEVISPVVVEEALLKHPDIRDALAFCVPHKTLQEVVGAVLVMRPERPRPTVSTLDQFLARHLHPSHWPRVLVFSDAVPRNTNNKLMRIKLSNRLGLKELQGNENPQSINLLYEAKCPHPNSNISEYIACWGVCRDLQCVQAQAMLFEGVTDAIAVTDGDTFLLFVVSEVPNIEKSLMKFLMSRLNAYDVPSKIIKRSEAFPLDEDGNVSTGQLLESISLYTNTFTTTAQILMAECFSAALGVEMSKLSPESDFFEMGGDSLKVGRLIYYIRNSFNVDITAITIYTERTLSVLADLSLRSNEMRSNSLDSELTITGDNMQAICNENVEKDNKVVNNEQDYAAYGNQNETLLSQGTYMNINMDDLAPNMGKAGNKKRTEELMRGDEIKKSNTLCWKLLGLSPVTLIRATRIIIIWISFAYFLVILRPLSGASSNALPLSSAIRLLAALAIGFSIGSTVMPTLSIVAKWIIIGRYRSGDYPLFGNFYKRWWFIEQVVKVNGRGVFSLTNGLRITYYRLLGAKIGKNVKIDKFVKLGECDLISIGDNTEINSEVWMRPFTMRTNYMMLREIKIGNNCVLNTKSTVAPGAKLEPNTILPPMSCSYEISSPDPKYEKFKSNSLYARSNPHMYEKIFLGYPVLAIVNLISYLPWVGVIVAISMQGINGIEFSSSGIIEAIYYFSTYKRLVLHLTALVAKRVLNPLIYGILAIVVKRLFIGKFKEGPINNTRRAHLKYWLSRSLFMNSTFEEFYSILGSHYGATSLVYRLLGAKVGKGIYWPGKNLRVFEFDLMEFGNNLVFGSRNYIYCSNSNEYKKIKLADGSMVADRCVVLPGVELGKNCVLGSGTLATGDINYHEESTWVGSQGGAPLLWNLGSSDKKLKSEDTSTPFSRAYYSKKAPYFILPYVMWFSISIVCKIASVLLWNMPITVSLLVSRQYLSSLNLAVSDNRMAIISTFRALAIMWTVIGIGSLLVMILTLTLDIVSKYILIGTRKVGTYDWDTSSYCQRWKVYLMISKIRSECLNYICGTEYIVIFFRMLGAKIGKQVCLYPLGADPMMTEPDLVEIGNNAAIDRASMIAHINSRGHFSLNKLKIGDNAVLRSNSRVLSGSEVQPNATLLEHTLLLSGDIADCNSIFQGWPSRKVSNSQKKIYDF